MTSGTNSTVQYTFTVKNTTPNPDNQSTNVNINSLILKLPTGYSLPPIPAGSSYISSIQVLDAAGNIVTDPTRSWQVYTGGSGQNIFSQGYNNPDEFAIQVSNTNGALRENESVRFSILVTNPPTATNATWNFSLFANTNINGSSNFSGTYPTTNIVACSAPSINANGQPGNQSITYGDNATFTFGTSSAAYHWQVNTTPVSGGTWTNITNDEVYSGATTSQLTVTNPSVSMNDYRYRAIASACNPAQTTTSNGNATLTVNAKGLTITAEHKEKTYDGQTFVAGGGTFTVGYAGFVTGEDETDLSGTLSFSGTATTAINVANNYVITPGGLTSSNYTITFVDGTLEITKAALTVTASDDSKTYSGVAYSGGNGVTYSGFVNGQTATVLGGTLAYSGTSQGAINVANNYVITPGGLTSSNYTITFVDGTLEITKAALTVTASDDSKTYSGVAYSGGNGVTYSGFVNGQTATVLGGTLAYSGTSQGAINVANNYVITPGGLTSSNYTITFVDGTLEITKAALTVTASDDSKTYSGVAYSGGNGVTYSGFVNGQTATVLGGTLAYSGTSQGAINVANNYVITPGGLTSSNYTITFVDGTLEITKAALTVTASDDSKTYSGVAYSGGNGVTYSGFVNGQTATVLGGTLAYSGTSQGAINVANNYVITPGGLTSSNYTITFVDGTLEITKAALTVTASDDSKTYSGVAYSGGNGVTYSGFVNGQTATVLGGTLAYSGTSQGAINVANNYVITPGGLTSSNYTITFVDGTLEITKAALTVTASDDSKTYSGVAYSGGNGVTYSGFVNGQTATVLGGTLAYSGTSQGANQCG